MLAHVALRVLILGAGFGGLELSTTLSEALGDEAEVTLIDKRDAFVFGYAKLDVLFGRTTLDGVRLPYADFAKPGVRLLSETVTAIDPDARRVTTDAGTHDADVLVIALGADYDMDATPGLADGANEFYSVEGAARQAGLLPGFTSGRAVIGVCGAPFKCPPAPSECALLLHDQLVGEGRAQAVRDRLPDPVRAAGAALAGDLRRADRGVRRARHQVRREHAGRRARHGRGIVDLDDGGELAYDLFLGVPKHRAPDVVIESGMTVDGYVPVDSATLETRWPGVYAVGDVATAGVPKAGVFAEGAARAVAETLIARVRGGEDGRHAGRGSCYIEFGGGRVGRVDVDFLSGPRPTGTYRAPSQALVAQKVEFGASRRARWFGR